MRLLRNCIIDNMKLDTETTLDFDRTVSTEDRFTIRRWIDSVVTALNTGNREVYVPAFSDRLYIEGFADRGISLHEYAAAFEKAATRLVARYPMLHLSYQHYLYHLSGTYEEFLDGLLVTEGTVEFALQKLEDEGFTIVRMKFFPRMLMQGRV